MKIIATTGIKRREQHLYFIDKDGDISEVPMRNSGIKKQIRKITKVGLKKRPNFLYFVNKDGNICEAAMSRKGAKKKKHLAKAGIKYLVYVQQKNGMKILRAKKLLLSSKGRNYQLNSPKKHNSHYGVLLTYEAKCSTRYKPTKKFIKLPQTIIKARLANKVPKMYSPGRGK